MNPELAAIAFQMLNAPIVVCEECAKELKGPAEAYDSTKDSAHYTPELDQDGDSKVAELRVGDMVLYHGTHVEYHGKYMIFSVPVDLEGRGYVISNGNIDLSNVHRESLTLFTIVS